MPKILVVEDDPFVRQNLTDLLTAEGFLVVSAANGLIALDQIQQSEPDLILCDVLMPQMDGFELLQRLQQAPETTSIPFIFLTAKSDHASFRRGMALGADDYLTKPFTRLELLEAIATRLMKQDTLQRLRQKVDELQQTSCRKDDFLDTVAHELRSPLANIKMAVEMLQVISDQQRQQSYLTVLQTECAREIELLNDLLDLQRLEAPPESRSLDPIELPAWLDEVISPFATRALQRQQVLQVAIAPNLPPCLTEVKSLRRVVTELLTNACKYTPPQGQIQVTVAATSHTITLQVRNQAEVPLEALPRLFERFYRVPRSDRWRQGGSGLGLALVKKLVEQLQGLIEVHYHDQWLQFTLHLPASSVPPQWQPLHLDWQKNDSGV